MILKRGSRAVVIVGSIFTVIGIALVGGAVHLLVHQRAPSTGLMGLLAFGWVSLATVVAMALAVASGLTSGKITRHVGVVSDIAIRSRAPAVFLYISAAGLAVTTVCLYVIGRTTPTGLGVGIAMAYFNANWAKQAVPGPERQ